MSVALIVNGVTYDYPEDGDEDWGPDATDWAQAVTQGMLQKAGGLFTLSAEADFGASFGLKSLYYKSRTANPSTTGQIRLANTDTINFRNAANSADLTGYGVNSSNQPTFAGNPLAVGSGDVTGPGSSTDNAVARFDGTTGKLLQNSPVIIDDSGNVTGVADLTLTDALVVAGATTLATSLTGVLKATSGLVSTGTIVNSEVSASAAIDFSKLAALTSANILLGSGANVPTSTAVTGDVLISNTGVTSINTGVIVNADVNASAAIDATKIANGSVTNTEFQYVGGVTSDIQTQLNAITAAYVTQSATTVFTASGTWTKATLNPKFIRVTVVGGGGGGGGCDASGSVSDSSCGSGGGGGGASIKTIMAASLGATETVTVGSGGTGGNTSGTDGTSGGTSSFGSHCSATGGGAGQGMATATSGLSNEAAADGGVGSLGNQNIFGGDGGVALVLGGDPTYGNFGGSSLFAGIRKARNSNGTGLAGHLYGGGGSGGLQNGLGGGQSGGAGAAGIVIVEEYY